MAIGGGPAGRSVIAPGTEDFMTSVILAPTIIAKEEGEKDGHRDEEGRRISTKSGDFNASIDRRLAALG